MNHLSCQKMCDLFPVDLGVDLRALQPEITQCKRRFQQDLWNTICSRVLEGQSGWKKDQSKEKSQSEEKAEKTEESGGGGGGESGGDGGGETKEEEPPKEDEEPKPEESGENENNARRMRGSGGVRNWSNYQQLGRSSRRSRQQMPPAARGYQAIRRSGGSIQRPLPQLPRQPPPQQQYRQQQQQYRQQQQQYQQQQQQYQQQQQQYQQPYPYDRNRSNRRVGDENGASVGELSQFLRRIRPQEGVLDWRDGGRPSRLQQHQQQPFNCTRSYSATSKREILGCCDHEHDNPQFSGEDEALDYSEAFEGAQVFYGQRGSGGGGCSDGETTTYLMNATNCGGADGATSSTMATREFVPLVVGNWWGGQPTRPQ